MICYDLIIKKEIKELKNIHNQYIYNFRHILDKINRRDLVMTSDDNNIKVWNINNWENVLHLQNIYKGNIFLEACFLNKNNSISIITSSYSKNNCRDNNFIKIYDLSKNIIKEIKKQETTIFIDTYEDKLFHELCYEEQDKILLILITKELMEL